MHDSQCMKGQRGMDTRKQAHVVWLGEGLEFQARISTGYSFTMRSPSNSQGASPMEFLLASVAGCTAMDVISILHKKRVALPVSILRRPSPILSRVTRSTLRQWNMPSISPKPSTVQPASCLSARVWKSPLLIISRRARKVKPTLKF